MIVLFSDETAIDESGFIRKTTIMIMVTEYAAKSKSDLVGLVNTPALERVAVQSAFP